VGGESKLASFRDGWRHLRFPLVHSPTHLFVLPGVVMTVLGALVTATVLTRLEIFGRQWELHSLIAGVLLMIVGAQVVALGLCAHAYGTYFMGEKDPWFDRMRARFRLDHGLMAGAAVGGAGLVIAAAIAAIWTFADPFVVKSGPLELTVEKDGRALTRGRAPRTSGEGPVDFPLGPVLETRCSRRASA